MKQHKFNHSEISGVIFDLDGVITDTASIHKTAWKEAFNKYLKIISKKKFLNSDYFNHIDGKPRLEAIHDYLNYRKIEKTKKLVNKINKEKNKLFRSLLKTKDIKVFKDAIDLLNQIKKYNIKVAVASSSKNCRFILKKIKLLNKFDFIVDGVDLEVKKINGKPNPGIFLIALKKLSLNKKKTLIFEDSSSGIISAKKSGVQFVIGVARKANEKTLKKAGSKIIINKINQIKIY